MAQSPTRASPQPCNQGRAEQSGQVWEPTAPEQGAVPPPPHRRHIHLGSQQGLGCAVRQGEVLHQETPQLPWVPGHRIQREGRHWTGRRSGLRASSEEVQSQAPSPTAQPPRRAARPGPPKCACAGDSESLRATWLSSRGPGALMSEIRRHTKKCFSLI